MADLDARLEYLADGFLNEHCKAATHRDRVIGGERDVVDRHERIRQRIEATFTRNVDGSAANGVSEGTPRAPIQESSDDILRSTEPRRLMKRPEPARA
ncbi:hypothetical protein GCM10017690_25910 [Microbacterium terregens]